MKRKVFLVSTLIFLLSVSLFSEDFLSLFKGKPIFQQKPPFSERQLLREDIKPGVHNMLFLKGDPEVSLDGDFVKITFNTYRENLFPIIYVGKEFSESKLSFPQYFYKLKPRKVKKNCYVSKFRVDTIIKRMYGKFFPTGKPLNFTYKLIFFLPEKSSKSFVSYLYEFSLIAMKYGNAYRFYKVPSFDVKPTIDYTGDNEITVSFRTSQSAFAILQYGEGKLDKTSDFISHGVEHYFKIRVNGYDRKYLYRVVLKYKNSKFCNVSKTYEFKTKCKKDENFSFGVFGDCRSFYENSDSNLYGVNYSVMKDVLKGFNIAGVDFVVGVGDYATFITNSPLDFVGELNSYRKVASFLSSYIPFFETRGDHEIFGHVVTSGKFMVVPYELPLRPENILPFYLRNPQNGPKKHRKNFPPMDGTVFSFRWGNSLFIALDTTYGIAHGVRDLSKYNINGTLCEEQFEWLEKELKRAKRDGVEHIFIFDHAPPFPNGGHIQDAMYYNGKNKYVNEVRKRFLRLISDYNIDILFCGHEHNYSRTLVDKSVDSDVKNSFWQIISGGAGAPTYPIDRFTPWHKNVKATSTEKNFLVVKVMGKKIMVFVYNRNMELIDSYSFKKK